MRKPRQALNYFYLKIYHMKFEVALTLAEIAERFQCSFVGDPTLPVKGINEIHRVVPGDLVFVDHPKYYQKALESEATVIIIDQEVDCPHGKGLLMSPTPFHTFNAITRYFSIPREPVNTPTNLQSMYPGVYIGKNVTLGNHVTIYPNTSILDGTIIEDHVTIGPNCVIGFDAFYYKKEQGEYTAMYSCGNVHIASQVEIGAGCTIDRGVTDTTYIGEGTKIDNLVQIGHDTRIGKNCLIAAQCGIAGCVTIGDGVTLWGQVGCASGVDIGAGAVVLAQSGISKALEGDKTYFGSPCSEVREKFKELAALKALPDFMNKHV